MRIADAFRPRTERVDVIGHRSPLVGVPCWFLVLRWATLLREVSRNEFPGDILSRFLRLFRATVSFHEELECAVRCHAVLE